MTPFNSTIDVLSGFGVGYQYATQKMREDEIKQGKNYYNASLLQSGQVGSLATVISRIASMTLSGTTNLIVQIASEVIPILMIPVSLLIAAVKQKNYEDFAHWWNNSESTYVHILPENLSETTNDIACFLAEHSGNMIRVAMIAGIAALIILGDIAFSVPALVALTYQIIDQCGWIPVPMSLFLETYLPIISLIGTILGGSLLLRIMALLTLPNYVMPSLHQYLLEKGDHLFRALFPSVGATLEEMNAELVVKKDLTFEEINEILDAPDNAYEVNPAHSSKLAFDLSKLPQDDDFNHFITLFDSIDWTQRYHLVSKRLADDEIFMDILIEKYPNVPKEQFQQNFDQYIDELAQEKGMTKEQFAADWTREQLGYLVAVLKGERRVKGSQRDLIEAIEDDKRIVAYLKNSERSTIEKEDAILKIAIEQGNYCARGIKRAANEMRPILMQTMNFEAEDGGDPITEFELKLRQALEQERWEMVQANYQKLIEGMSEINVSNVVADVHNFDLYRSICTFGYYPMTAYEKSRFGFLDLLLWNSPGPAMFRAGFYLENNPTYRGRSYLRDVAQKMRAKVYIYIANVINANPKLSSEQREAILNRFLIQFDDDKKLDRQFYRLMYVMLGVMQKKAVRPKLTPFFFSVVADAMQEGVAEWSSP